MESTRAKFQAVATKKGSGVRYEKLVSLLRIALDLRGNAESLRAASIGFIAPRHTASNGGS
jgi:hypothetical protein